jgi:hypothetical protein
MGSRPRAQRQPVVRRAIQLGLRGAALVAFGERELLEAVDMPALLRH